MQQLVQSGRASATPSAPDDDEPVMAMGAVTPDSAPQSQAPDLTDEQMQQLVKQGRAKPQADEISDEDMQKLLQSGKARPASTLKSNAAGAFFRNAVEGVAPAVGALPAVGPGFAAGAAVGGA